MIGLPSLQALDGAPGPRIWLAAKATDMRRGFDRVARRVQTMTGEVRSAAICSYSGRLMATP